MSILNDKDSWELKYFTKSKYFRAKCKLCVGNTPVIHLYADTTDLLGHFENRHPEIDVSEEVLWIWQYYKKLERDSCVECKECGKKYTIDLVKTHGNDHLHEHELFLLEEEDIYQPLLYWNHITQYDDWHVKCDVCYNEIEVSCMLTALNYHMYAKHRDIWKKEQSEMCKNNIQKITDMSEPTSNS